MNDDTLWERIKQTISPLNRDDVLKTEVLKQVRPNRKAQPKAPKPKSLVSRPPASPYQSTLKTPLPFSEIDRKTQRKIDKGAMPVDGKLDLHGLTVAQAHQQFNRYIRTSAAQGRRCIVVVTGKGDPTKGSGTIRRELPHWAQGSEVSHYIHSLSEPIKNKGRYIILLRRNRNG